MPSSYAYTDHHPDQPPPPPRPRPPPPAAPTRAPSLRSKPTSTSRADAIAAALASDSNVVKCTCGLPAIQKRTTAGASAGRLRWGCPKTDDTCCLFFKFVDENSPSSQPPPGTTIPTKRPYSSYSQNNTNAGHEEDPDARKCKCGQAGVQRTSQKENANKGRVFWVCAKPMDAGDRCDFFEWADEPPRNAAGGQGGGGGYGGSGGSSGLGMGNRTGSGGGAVTGECFKCNQTGHWSRGTHYKPWPFRINIHPCDFPSRLPEYWCWLVGDRISKSNWQWWWWRWCDWRVLQVQPNWALV